MSRFKVMGVYRNVRRWRAVANMLIALAALMNVAENSHERRIRSLLKQINELLPKLRDFRFVGPGVITLENAHEYFEIFSTKR